MRLYWHAPDVEERDWLRFLLEDAVHEEVSDPGLEALGDDGIHVVSTNLVPLRELDRRMPPRQAPGTRVLVHLSDEWFSGGYATYRHFDAVVRTHHTHLAVGPGILTIPLGYPNREGSIPVLRPASERTIAWSFVGEMKASRHEMAEEMTAVGAGTLLDTADPAKRLSKPAFDALLADSSFSPCPMGNVMLETWRLYESMELGAIPLVERRPTLDYFSNLLGDRHPVPTFGSWGEAARWCRRLLAEPPAMNAVQERIGAWWAEHKMAVREEVSAHVIGASRARDLRAFARSPSNRSVGLYEPLRMIELVRHQSAASLARRLLDPRAILARVARDSGGSAGDS